MTPILNQYGIFIVLAFVAVESLVSFLRKDRKYDAKDTLANIVMSVIGTAIGRTVWAGVAYFVYDRIHAFAPRPIAMNGVAPWAAMLVAADFIWYWEHRISHQARVLWAVHSVHHSSERFNYSVAMRLPWLGGLVRIPFLAPLAFIGFPPVAIFTGFSLVFLYQIWVHTEYVGKLGVLEEVLSTPSHHRVHHATNSAYLDKNYGGILIVWDRFFGTFERETAQASYGILHPIASSNPLVIQFRDLVAAFRMLGRARSPREAAQIAFGDPAYVPVAVDASASPAQSTSRLCS